MRKETKCWSRATRGLLVLLVMMPSLGACSAGLRESQSGSQSQSGDEAGASSSQQATSGTSETGDPALAPQIVDQTEGGDGSADSEQSDNGTAPVEISDVDANFRASDSVVEVSAFVIDYVGEGSCTYSASDASGNIVEMEAVAIPDAQTTLCPRVELPLSGAGEWTVQVVFANSSRSGTSAPLTIETTR